MSGYELLKTRLSYMGGNKQVDRMNKDKLSTLKKALNYSYQSATIMLSDSREFRGLMNPERLNLDEDIKILSIPFEDKCLTTNAMEEIPVKVGDVFTWKETNSQWLVYLQYIEETAYFRAQVLKCKYEVVIDGVSYWAYIKGPKETSIDWQQKEKIFWNNLNYSALLYITNNEITSSFFHRFKKIKINGNTWEVQAVDSISTAGVLKVTIKEHYNNSIEDAAKEENKEEIILPDETSPYIQGESVVSPYDIKEYYIINAEGGQWELSNNKAKIQMINTSSVIIEIITGRSGNFNLIYKINDKEIVFPITIKSL